MDDDEVDPFAPEWPHGIPKDVAVLFADLTIQLIRAGFTRYSSDAVLHRIRWYHHVEMSNRTFKCNDNWTAYLSRWFMKKYPQHQGFFELRASPGTIRGVVIKKSDDGDAAYE